MKSVIVKKLDYEEFRIYGVFANMLDPKAPKLGAEPVEFFRDMAVLELGNSSAASFSTCRVLNRELTVTELEYHNYTGEGMLPVDGDVLLAFARATAGNDLPADQVEVFYVPKGTFVAIRPGVWHGAPYSAGADCVNTLIVLPERTYANDCKVFKLSGELCIKIQA